MAITALAVNDVIIDIDHRTMGQSGSHWQLTAGIGLPRAPRLPQTVAGGLASLSAATTASPSSVPSNASPPAFRPVD